jgi:hypothetical protein
MVDNYDRKDVPGSGVKPEKPDVGGSVTIDSDGHVRKVEVDVHVPGTSGGSDPAHWEHSDDPSHPDHKQPWVPDMRDPNEPVYNPLPVQPGWVRDPKTGLDHPDFSDQHQNEGVQGVDEVPMSEPGDYPEPDPDEQLA